eukprot:COSAG02_NODE_536_length_20657_cov_91.744041_4_plen_149_part_00
MHAARAARSPLLAGLTMMAAALVGFYAGFVRCVGAEPPNISLTTLPVAYYGSSYIEKTPQVYEMFSKMRIVVLMQQDGDRAAGHCWLECCPEKDWDPIGRCQGGGGTSRSIPLNASLNSGCNSSCDQHGKQVRRNLSGAVATAACVDT